MLKVGDRVRRIGPSMCDTRPPMEKGRVYTVSETQWNKYDRYLSIRIEMTSSEVDLWGFDYSNYFIASNFQKVALESDADYQDLFV